MIWSSSHTKLIAAGLIGLLALFAASAYVHSQIVQAKNQATQSAQAEFQRQLADQQKQMQADFDAKLKARDEEYQAALSATEKRFQSTVTPQQLAALASELMSLKEPIRVSTPQATADNPNPTPVAEIPLIDAPQAKQYLLECETCKQNLAKTQADLADVQQQRAVEAKLAEQQIDSLKQQRDAAIKAAKGGGFWSRLKSNARWFVIGAAGGAVALCTTGHCK